MTKLNEDRLSNILIDKANKDKAEQVDAQFKAVVKDLKHQGPLFVLMVVGIALIAILLFAL